MQILLLVTIISLASFAFARSLSQTCPISYHVYGNGQISGSCDYYSQVSKYGGYITATTLGLACFSCVQMSYGSNTIYVTVVDTGGMNFDLNQPAFQQLCGDAGINAGQCTINWQVVSASNCIGNPNGGQSASPPSSSPPSGGGGGSVRCGSDWSDANGKCGSSCSDDSQCGGQYCYASLSTSPCSGSSSPPSNPPPSPPSNSGSTTRCGANWGDANVNCKAACSNNGPCGGETCYANLDISPCGSNAIAAPLVTVPTSNATLAASGTGTDTATPAWAIALIVVGSLVLVGLIVVIAQVAFLLR